MGNLAHGIRASGLFIDDGGSWRRKINALDHKIVNIGAVPGNPLHASPDGDVGIEATFHNIPHLLQGCLGTDLDTIHLAKIADISHRIRNQKAPFPVKLLPNHLADHLTITTIVKSRFEVKRNNNFLTALAKARPVEHKPPTGG